MTTNDVTGQDFVVAEIHIAAPSERVFQAITQPEQLKRWFTDGECPAKLWEVDARQGGRWRFAGHPSAKSLNGTNEFRAGGEILEIDPPRLLVYTWHANWHDDPSLATIVRWEFQPINNGTQVKVTHSGLAKEKVAREDYSGGWVGVLSSLKNFSEQTVSRPSGD
jgi:uncharacterized protein YndB with AHSA1/START domain